LDGVGWDEVKVNTLRRRRQGVGVGGNIEVVFGHGRDVGDGQGFDRGFSAGLFLVGGVAVGAFAELGALFLELLLVLFGFLFRRFGFLLGGLGKGLGGGFADGLAGVGGPLDDGAHRPDRQAEETAGAQGERDGGGQEVKGGAEAHGGRVAGRRED